MNTQGFSWIPWILSGLLLGACAWLIYLLIDTSLSLTYARASVETTNQALADTSAALELALDGRSKDEVLALLRNMRPSPQQEIEELDSGKVFINGVVIRFDDGGKLEVNP